MQNFNLDQQSIIVLCSLFLVMFSIIQFNKLATLLSIKATVFLATCLTPKKKAKKPTLSPKNFHSVNKNKLVSNESGSVIFNVEKSQAKLEKEQKEKAEFDAIFSIPAYARKGMNINYPASFNS